MYLYQCIYFAFGLRLDLNEQHAIFGEKRCTNPLNLCVKCFSCLYCELLQTDIYFDEGCLPFQRLWKHQLQMAQRVQLV